MTPNKGGHARRQCSQESIDLVRFASDDDFDLPVGKIADEASHGMLVRDLFRGGAEADALHSAPVVDTFARCHISRHR